MSLVTSSDSLLQPEFSRIYKVNEMPENGVHVKITPSNDEMAALEKRLGVVAIKSFHIEGHLKPNRSRTKLHFEGMFKSDLVQACVITLDPVDEHVEEALDLWFEDRKPGAGQADIELLFANRSEDADDEIMINGEVDLGEVMVQHLSVAMNPYPRKEGVNLEQIEWAKNYTAADKGGPFAALEKLKKNFKPEGE